LPLDIPSGRGRPARPTGGPAGVRSPPRPASVWARSSRSRCRPLTLRW